MSAIDTFMTALDALREELREEVRVELQAAMSELREAERWPAYMDAPTAAAYIGAASAAAIRKLQYAGKLDYCQEGPGCRVLYPRDGLDAYMDAHRREARR
jgi:hypothetical protein